MPLFEGHKDAGVQRLFIEFPDDARGSVVYKWPDQQILQHSQVNVDLDEQAVFTNLGRVIGVLGPGRWPLDEGASLTLGWLVDRLTGNAYYDAELFFVTTRDLTGIPFGGPVDNLADGPTGLIVSPRVFGELAYRVVDPSALLAHLVGTGSGGDPSASVAEWVKDQTLAALRTVLPDLVAQHGVLAMGQIQDATASATLAKANAALAPWGLALTAFGELNVNLPDADAQQLKQLAAAKAYTSVAGSFDAGVRGQAALEIAQGVASGTATSGIVSGLAMGLPVTPNAAAAAAPAPAAPVASAPGAHFCSQCGTALPPGARFCASCGTAVAGAPEPVAVGAPGPAAVPEAPVAPEA
jgi:membrane protease subunit (stomatin/prohibitin family)